MKPLITVIVPVYNTGAYIKKCIDSITSQTYDNIEIILVDDGSTDSSPEICDTLAASDSRIKVFHKENGGVSEARNFALDRMSGEYVSFIDGDDFVADDYIECLFNALSENNADISTCGHYRIEIDGTLKQIFKFDENPDKVIINSGKDAITQMFYGQTLSASSCCKLYKRSIFNNLRYPGYIMGEDTFVAYYALKAAKNVVHTNRALYYYVQHSASVTNNKANYIKFYDYVKLYDHIISSESKNDKSEYMLSIYNRLIENNFWVYMKLRNCPNMYLCEKMHIEDNIKKYRKFVMGNPKATLRVRLACALSYSGMTALNFVYDRITQ